MNSKLPGVGHLQRLRARFVGIDLEQEIVRRRVQALEAALTDDTRNREAADAVATLLSPRPSSHRFRRLGGPADGGYVVADLGTPTLAVSVGVGMECTADDELATAGTEVWQFDHTIAGTPSASDKVRFVAAGVGGPAAAPPCLPMAGLMARIEPWRDPAWLLMDVEGAEWDVLEDPSAGLHRFEQIVIELHGLSQVVASPAWQRGFEALEALCLDHVPAVWHANNFAPTRVVGGRWVPEVLELTLVHRDRWVPGDRFPPATLFRPNDPRRQRTDPPPFAPAAPPAGQAPPPWA